MKVTYFRLRGYIKVLNGMGLEEIVIPFASFKNRVILIQGENGTSKSTIISALSPNPDTSDDFRTDVFIDEFGNRQIIEYPAEKEIHYIDKDENGDINDYGILIQSIVDESRTRRTTKAFISKNGEELNPNGNVSSFKEIRDSILGIDPIYLDLSSVSAENRGIVDMIPSERRKYMASYIGSLDTYNNIFKVISKKVNSLKSYMNTLNTKIYELGDENELRLKLIQLETSLDEYNTQRDNLIKDLAEAESITRIVDPDNKMRDLYSSISEQLNNINSEIKQNDEKYGRIYSSLSLKPENDIYIIKDNLEKDIEENKKKSVSNKNEVNTLLTLNESSLSQLESDRSILSGLSTNTIQDNIEIAVENLRNEIKMYKSYITSDDEEILKSISSEELTDIRNTIINFVEEIKITEELYGQNEFIDAVNISMNNDLEKNLSDEIQSLIDSSIELEIETKSLSKELNSAISDLEILKDFDNTRPKDCHIDNCPFIAKFINIKNSGISDKKISDSLKEIEEKNDRINDNSNKILYLKHVDEICRRLDIIFSSLLSKKSSISKIKGIEKLIRIEFIKSKVMNHNRFQNEIDIISSIIEKSFSYQNMKNAEIELSSLNLDLKNYMNNKSLIDSLNKSIKDNEEKYNSRIKDINSLNKESIFLDNLVLDLTSKLEKINDMIEYDKNLSNLKIEKENLKKEFDSVKDKIKLMKEKLDSVNEIKTRLSRVDESIAPLSDTINQIKFNLANIVEYQTEYKDSADKYDKMVFIRNACSPGNGLGIQSEYIKRYMNDIIIDCNKMLGYMFGGGIQLSVPIINEKQFSIPFIGPNGIIVPDISNGSTAQKCMIGLVFSCVAMMKSSLKYNIPRFDEIDGGLDQQNRIEFINVLNQILDFMSSEQCIICSHNTEFDDQSTTRLLFSHNGIRIEQ